MLGPKRHSVFSRYELVTRSSIQDSDKHNFKTHTRYKVSLENKNKQKLSKKLLSVLLDFRHKN